MRKLPPPMARLPRPRRDPAGSASILLPRKTILVTHTMSPNSPHLSNLRNHGHQKQTSPQPRNVSEGTGSLFLLPSSHQPPFPPINPSSSSSSQIPPPPPAILPRNPPPRNHPALLCPLPHPLRHRLLPRRNGRTYRVHGQHLHGHGRATTYL